MRRVLQQRRSTAVVAHHLATTTVAFRCAHSQHRVTNELSRTTDSSGKKPRGPQERLPSTLETQSVQQYFSDAPANIQETGGLPSPAQSQWRLALSSIANQLYSDGKTTDKEVMETLVKLTELYAPWTKWAADDTALTRLDLPPPKNARSHIERVFPENQAWKSIGNVTPTHIAFALFSHFVAWGSNPSQQAATSKFINCLQNEAVEHSTNNLNHPVLAAINALRKLESKFLKVSTENKAALEEKLNFIIQAGNETTSALEALPSSEQTLISTTYREFFAAAFTTLLRSIQPRHLGAENAKRLAGLAQSWMKAFRLPEYILAEIQAVGHELPEDDVDQLFAQCKVYARKLEAQLADKTLFAPAGTSLNGVYTPRELAWSYVIMGVAGHHGARKERIAAQVASLLAHPEMAAVERLPPAVCQIVFRLLLRSGWSADRLQKQVPKWCPSFAASPRTLARELLLTNFSAASQLHTGTFLEPNQVEQCLRTLDGEGLYGRLLDQSISVVLAADEVFEAQQEGNDDYLLKFCLDLVLRHSGELGVRRSKDLVKRISQKNSMMGRNALDALQRKFGDQLEHRAAAHSSTAVAVGTSTPQTWRLATLQLQETVSTEGAKYRDQTADAMTAAVVAGQWNRALVLYSKAFSSGSYLHPQVAKCFSAALVQGNVWWGALEALNSMARGDPNNRAAVPTATVFSNIFEVYRNKRRWEETEKLVALLNTTQSSQAWMKPVAHHIVGAFSHHPRWRAALAMAFPGSTLNKLLTGDNFTKLHAELVTLLARKNPAFAPALLASLQRKDGKFPPRIARGMYKLIFDKKLMHQVAKHGDIKAMSHLASAAAQTSARTQHHHHQAAAQTETEDESRPLDSSEMQNLDRPQRVACLMALGNSTLKTFPSVDESLQIVFNLLHDDPGMITEASLTKVFQVGQMFGVLRSMTVKIFSMLALAAKKGRMQSSSSTARQEWANAEDRLREYLLLSAAVLGDQQLLVKQVKCFPTTTATNNNNNKHGSGGDEAGGVVVNSSYVLNALHANMHRHYFFFAEQASLHRVGHRVKLNASAGPVFIGTYCRTTLHATDLAKHIVINRSSSSNSRDVGTTVERGQMIQFSFNPKRSLTSNDEWIDRFLLQSTFEEGARGAVAAPHNNKKAVKFAALLKDHGVNTNDLVATFSRHFRVAVRPLFPLAAEVKGIIVLVEANAPIAEVEARLRCKAVVETFRDDYTGRAIERGGGGTVGFREADVQWLKQYKGTVISKGAQQGEMKLLVDLDLGRAERGIPSGLHDLTMCMALEGWRVGGNTRMQEAFQRDEHVSGKHLLTVDSVDLMHCSVVQVKKTTAIDRTLFARIDAGYMGELR